MKDKSQGLPNIDNSLVTTISENGGAEILADLGEVSLDAVIDNEAINQIPVIGTLRGIYKITNSISDYIFIQNILKFLKELNLLSAEEKQKMKLKIDSGKAHKIGETLLVIVNKIDDNEKPMVIAKIFKAYINDEIDFNEFRKFSQIINKSFLPDVLRIMDFSGGQPITNEHSGALVSMGLISLVSKKYNDNQISLKGIAEREIFEYQLNTEGKKLLKILYPDFQA